jgi:hypothetical protein
LLPSKKLQPKGSEHAVFDAAIRKAKPGAKPAKMTDAAGMSCS